MNPRIALFFLLAIAGLASADVVQEVNDLLAKGDFAGATAKVQSYRRKVGVTPEILEAESWIARAHFSARRLDQAEKTAQETYQLAAAELKKRRLDSNPNSPLALALG